MTKSIGENSGVIVRWGIIAAALVTVLLSYHTRISAVELQQVEQKTDIKYIKEAVDEIKQAVKK